MSDSNGGAKFTFFLAGLGIGAVLALLFAPRSGEETRQLLGRKADETRELLGKKADEGREYVTTKSREVRRQAEELVEKAKDLVTQQKEQLSAALDAGRQAYQEEKSKSR